MTQGLTLRKNYCLEYEICMIIFKLLEIFRRSDKILFEKGRNSRYKQGGEFNVVKNAAIHVFLDKHWYRGLISTLSDLHKK